MNKSLVWIRASALLCAATLAAAGCHGGGGYGGNGGGGGGPGNGTLGTATPAANGTQFNTPFDAAPSADGSRIYFTAIDSTTGQPAVFQSGAGAGSTAAVLVNGASVGFGSSIATSTDGNTVYVADPAASTANDKGVIFSVPGGGGSPTQLAETADYAPTSLSVARVGNADVLYFIGADKADGSSGIFQDRGGSVSAVIKGGAAGNPEVLAAGNDGTVYFFDSARGLVSVAPGAAAAAPLPGAAASLRGVSGLALSQDGSALIASTQSAAGTSSIQRISLADGSVAAESAAVASKEAGGLHRAANADVYAFADLSAGSSGTVYVLSK